MTNILITMQQKIKLFRLRFSKYLWSLKIGKYPFIYLLIGIALLVSLLGFI